MNRWYAPIVIIALAAGFVRADDSYEITPDLVYGHKAGMALTMDMIRPQEQNGAAVMFMMSGGWHSAWIPPETFMSPQAPFGLTHFQKLVDKGYTVFIVRHGSEPYFKVPDAVADVRRATRFVRHHAEKYGIDPDRIGVCGASAGGHLSLILGTTSDDGVKEAKDEIDREENDVAAVVAYFPPVDLREWVGDERFAALHFDPELAESVSPLMHVSEDDAPTLLIHGDKDELVTLDNSERIHEAFEKENVPTELLVIEGAGHAFPGEMGTRASAALIEWFDEHLAKKNGAARPVGEPEKAGAAN